MFLFLIKFQFQYISVWKLLCMKGVNPGFVISPPPLEAKVCHVKPMFILAEDLPPI